MRLLEKYQKQDVEKMQVDVESVVRKHSSALTMTRKRRGKKW